MDIVIEPILVVGEMVIFPLRLEGCLVVICAMGVLHLHA